MLNSDTAARRNELAFRLRFWGVQTRLFRVAPYQYQIVCENLAEPFDQVQKIFDREIREIGLHISLVQELPELWEEELDRISLDNPVDEFGYAVVTMRDLEEYIASRYMDMDVRAVCSNRGGLDFAIRILVGTGTTEQERERMRRELLLAGLGTDDIKVETTEQLHKETRPTSEDLVMRLYTTGKIPLLKDEADFWYENIEAVYQGNFTRKQMDFARMDTSKCLVDASVFPVMNLRSLLLLYDTVYLEVPIEHYLEIFLEQQGISRSELIELVTMGKLVFLLPNAEQRYDRQLILDAYREMPQSVIGRRRINTLLTAHLVELRNRCLQRFPELYECACELKQFGIQKDHKGFRFMGEFLSWPILAPAQCFQIFQNYSPMQISNFGINQVLLSVFKDQEHFSEIEFELLMKALSPHLAGALQATYFPFQTKPQSAGQSAVYTDASESRMMGDLLRVFWYDYQQISDVARLLDANEQEQNAVKLISAKDHISILHTAKMADSFDTPAQFKRILTNLSQCSGEKRKQMIRQYNDLLLEAAECNDRTGFWTDMALGAASFFPMAAPFAWILNGFGLAKTTMGQSGFLTKRKRIHTLEKLAEQKGLEHAREVAEDVYFLDKISPVAHLI